MTNKTAQRLRELAGECVHAAYITEDVDAASTLLDVASSLIDLANGKASSPKRVEPILSEFVR